MTSDHGAARADDPMDTARRRSAFAAFLASTRTAPAAPLNLVSPLGFARVAL
jgi:hypothetical protein